MRHVLILFDTRVTHRGSCLVNRRYQRLNFLSLNLLPRIYNAKRAVSLSVSCASSPHNFIVWGGPGRKGLISVKITPHVPPSPIIMSVLTKKMFHAEKTSFIMPGNWRFLMGELLATFYV